MLRWTSVSIGLALSLLIAGIAPNLGAASVDGSEGDATVQKVSFPHHTVTMVGNQFLPPDLDPTKKYPAIGITHPFGGM